MSDGFGELNPLRAVSLELIEMPIDILALLSFRTGRKRMFFRYSLFNPVDMIPLENFCCSYQEDFSARIMIQPGV